MGLTITVVVLCGTVVVLCGRAITDIAHAHDLILNVHMLVYTYALLYGHTMQSTQYIQTQLTITITQAVLSIFFAWLFAWQCCYQAHEETSAHAHTQCIQISNCYIYTSNIKCNNIRATKSCTSRAYTWQTNICGFTTHNTQLN